MRKYFRSVLVPGYVWSRVAPGDAQERDLVAEDVFIIEMRRQDDFRSLKRTVLRVLKFRLEVTLRSGCCSTGRILGPGTCR